MAWLGFEQHLLVDHDRSNGSTQWKWFELGRSGRDAHASILAATTLTDFDRAALPELARDLVDSSAASGTWPTSGRLTEPGINKEQKQVFVNKEKRMDPIKILRRAWTILWS